jgi:hypothetical protein
MPDIAVALVLTRTHDASWDVYVSLGIVRWYKYVAVYHLRRFANYNGYTSIIGHVNMYTYI